MKEFNIEYYLNEFLPKLKQGQIFEELAINRIINFLDGKYHLITTCNNYKYDFMLSNGIRYEVKTDEMSIKTNNIFIEYEQFKNNSGIRTTQADFYIIIIPCKIIEYYVIEVDILKSMINDKLYTFIYKNKFKSGYIFKKVDIVDNSDQI